MLDCRLCIYTNTVPSTPSTDLIDKTYQSFLDTFEEIPVTVYLDPNPEHFKFDEYFKNLKFPEVIKTTSLSHGYRKSIKENNERYIFQLEHDWEFQNISHSLKDLLELMRENNFYHFRFNKNPNTLEVKSKARIMNEGEWRGIKYVETDSLSNNPHIIDREYYKSHLLGIIKASKGSRGIEERLTNRKYLSRYYGGLNYPPTIKHINGKCFVNL